MSSIQTRNSVLAVVPETTEGTPVVPTSASQYLALQDDFTASPEFEKLDNAELKSSLAPAASIQGAEAPKMSLSHYLRASGVEGQAPNYKELLEAALGTEVVASTQYDTVNSSSVSVINVDTAEGANFQRGQALLIKDPINGYRVRCLDSVSSDALTMGFQVPTAPLSGVNLGKAILYKPANSGHQTLSLWHYLGNGGATQMMSGARVVGIDVTAEAGQLVNASYSLEGVSFYFNPITITASTRFLDFTDDDGTWAASVTAKTYKDPHDLASALQAAMRAANAGETATVTYSNTTGKFTIKTTGTVLTLKWNTGSNTANTIGTKIGFLVAADDSGTGATTGYTSDNAQDFSAPQTPTYDDSDALAAKNHEVMIGDTADYQCFGASSITINLSTPKADLKSICAESGVAGSVITERVTSIQVTARLEKYDASKWQAFREGVNTKFQYTFGAKSGGNWVAGKTGAIYSPTTKITAWTVEDSDGLVILNFTLEPYADNQGRGEFYINFV